MHGDLIVQLALMHKYGIITVLPCSMYARPIFAQRKPNGILRLRVDLRKINSLIADHINNNHRVSTLSDAAQHLAGKSLFCKLDCSQAYQCLQTADQRSVEMLAFNSASRTLAYKRHAQGLRRSVSSFPSFMREYLDPVNKADQCAQKVDDIGIAANNASESSGRLQMQFPSRIETDNWEVPLCTQTNWFPRKNKFTRSNLTTSPENSKFPWQTKIPQIEKSITAISGFRELLQKLYSQDG